MRNRLPAWFKQKIPEPAAMQKMERLLGRMRLHTICENALCPNMGQCFERSTATFLILGDVCTRHCTFCAVKKGPVVPVDESEPDHICEAVRQLQLKYVVITSVTRDDIADGGASQFAKVIRFLAKTDPDLLVEVLVPDFKGSMEAIDDVATALPDVVNHNVETVPRLYRQVRPEADYSRSLRLLSRIKGHEGKMVTKSGLMLGLGEKEDEVINLMADLRESGCDILTMGQYLQPSPGHHPVISFISPEKFSEYEIIARGMGFSAVAAAPLVRSSYRAAELYGRARENGSRTRVREQSCEA
jgi:lipoic acid synthetase